MEPHLLPLCVLQSHSEYDLITALIFTVNFWHTNNCVKTCLPHSTNCMGVSRATGIHLLQSKAIWVLSTTEKSLPCHSQQRTHSASLGNSKDPNKSRANSSVQFHNSFFSPVILGAESITAEGKEFLSKNSSIHWFLWTSETEASRRKSRNQTPESGKCNTINRGTRSA